MTKTLQIIRVDHDLVQKADLQIGDNIIGRGVALECNGKQVFRHALIINLSSDGAMTITPMVPCYMKASGRIRWQSLKLGSCIPISPGDVCSLLPEKCWFKIISVPETMEKNNQTLKRKADEDLNDEIEDKKVCLSFNEEEARSPAETLNDFLNGKESLAKCLNPINGNHESNDMSVPVLKEMYSPSCAEGSDVSATCSKMSHDLQDVVESSVNVEDNTEEEKRNINLANKVATSVESEEKTEWDHDDHLSVQVEAAPPVKNESQSPVITHQDQASDSDHENPEVPKKEKCMYGARCYRRNPNHKNNYSHPGDADYDEVDDREECPYGLKCYRKNLQHKAQFKHTTIPRHRRAAVSKQSVAVNTETDASSTESVDESDYEPSVYTESSDTKSDSDDSRSEWEDGTTG